MEAHRAVLVPVRSRPAGWHGTVLWNGSAILCMAGTYRGTRICRAPRQLRVPGTVLSEGRQARRGWRRLRRRDSAARVRVETTRAAAGAHPGSTGSARVKAHYGSVGGLGESLGWPDCHGAGGEARRELARLATAQSTVGTCSDSTEFPQLRLLRMLRLLRLLQVLRLLLLLDDAERYSTASSIGM